MADYKDKLDEWQRAAKQKARELDEKYGIKDRIEDGARVAQDAAKRGAETAAKGAERIRAEAERLNDEEEVKERVRRAGEEASRRARDAERTIRGVAGEAGKRAGKKAGEVLDGAKDYYDRAAKVVDAGARFTRASGSATSALFKAGDWIRKNPGKAALVTFSLGAGIRAGAAFPGLDAILIGSHPHWFTHSALPVYGLRKVGEKFDGYLKKQERLVAEGNLSEAERERARFERKVVKLVGAPLLGAFSCAAGAAMWAQILNPAGPITGAPISWLLGGNPILEGVWLFANGVLCFHQGYKFFMIALADEKDVARFVKEIKGLLPAGEAA
ncbi:MAG TPA: hypothetical protein VK619_03700 [Pyrinomonadaceae bacterium]|nr:hypothetical protein [Pyrinomonadaceae bacterium]